MPPRPDFAEIDTVLQPDDFKDAEKVRQLSEWADVVTKQQEELDKYVQALKDEILRDLEIRRDATGHVVLHFESEQRVPPACCHPTLPAAAPTLWLVVFCCGSNPLVLGRCMGGIDCGEVLFISSLSSAPPAS